MKASRITPAAQGLYDPSTEKDSCGMGFVANVKGQRSHDIIHKALFVLDRLSHRGAQGCDPCTGDGSGVLVQVSHRFFEKAAAEQGIELPPPGEYGVGMVFLPRKNASRKAIQAVFERIIAEEGLVRLGWREVPVDSSVIGELARAAEPVMRQVFVGIGEASGLQAARWLDPRERRLAFERALYIIRKRVENQVAALKLDEEGSFAIPSFSTRKIVYKGLLLPQQIEEYYRDLQNPLMETALALVHSRFSTNTFPSWPLAHPFRYLCHNGEINTLKGNLNWMRARQGRLHSDVFGDLSRLYPIIAEGQSDSACLDNALEFLVLGGRSLPHAMMMLIPEPWGGNAEMDFERRGFYEYHSAMMEPWDGPAAVCFTDGSLVGATLDRNGLRPCRYQVTSDDLVVLASEAGVLPEEPSKIIEKGRLQPGRMFLVDTEQGRIVSDDEIKSRIVREKPYRAWVMQDRVSLDELPEPINVPQPDHLTLRQRQQAFGYTIEELKRVLQPMATNGEEPISSMGCDTPLAVLSDKPQLLFSYFRQLFAQVTNPPIDPEREHLVMSLTTSIGPRPNLLQENPGTCRRIKAQSPILTNMELEKIRRIADPRFKSKTLPILFRVSHGPDGLRRGLVELCRRASEAVREGYKFLILSDRDLDAQWAPIPVLLAVSAVNHYLVRKSLRGEVGLILETGEPRDVHHFACLIGYGAGSINPYLVFETLVDMARDGYFPEAIDAQTAHVKYLKAINKGLLKIISKMGISTIQSYNNAQIFEAIGLSRDLVDRYFTGTASRIGGIGLHELGEETLKRHAVAFEPVPWRMLDFGGNIHYQVGGEQHGWNPEAIYKLQHATSKNDPRSFREFSEKANADSGNTLRGLLDFKFLLEPVPIEQIEPASEIVKRFTTGAMSLGAISPEAHETLAIAMNRIGGKSNTGEGGEDPVRYKPLPNGDSRSSAIKQVASARFGVNAEYLTNAREIQIKMAQGAKPGEGGQLPGHKVNELIARLRHSTPGVTLISPPPHHDIYSIEDLAQLIFDLKNVNPSADISVKLVSEVGIGPVAVGVAKARAEKILVSGDSGGTGASPLSSIKYAGIPWELGLAETHQSLVLNGLRGRVRLETDGQMKTGRDVAIAALLGAEEYGFATAPLIVEGCIMMRKCHLNTCPVGIATQDPALRKKFNGQPEHLINYFFFVAEELREIMARLGFRTVAEMIGRVDRLSQRRDVEHWKARHLDLSPLLVSPRVGREVPLRSVERQHHSLDCVLDRDLIELCTPAIQHGQNVQLGFSGELPIENTDRAVGAMLSGEIVRYHGSKGLPEGSIRLRFKGSAGQSFGAFLVPGVTVLLEGESNDYLGKSLSGGRIIVVPPKGAAFPQGKSILIGNTCLYGAISGEAYFNGTAGERFAVRNSGALAVVEGVGDHGCEYMTGGTAVVLGPTGRNFAAGMSGGMAFVLDETGMFPIRCNTALVELEKLATPEDEELVLRLLRSHLRFTNSAKARQVLENWQALREKFVKVMPVDYKKVLELRKAQRAQIKSPETVSSAHV